MTRSPLPSPALPPVTILLASYQGAAHLGPQLHSLAEQDHRDWALWVSDDGSTDGTRDILDMFRRDHPDRDIRLVEGPRRGAAANFLSLMCHPDLPPGHVALADQDDLWSPHKLSHGLMALTGHDGPAVYSAQSRHIDGTGRVLGVSRVHSGAPSFGNALVQNRVTGHCAVLTPAALELVRAVGMVEVPFHDWWLYLLITGAGGHVNVSPEVVLDYRQHGDNVLGAHRGLLAGLARAAMVLGPTYRGWQARNRAALEQARPWLTPQARALLAELDAAPARGIARARLQARLGLTRDRPGATAFLRLAALFGRV
ncbi:glycosyltransferase [Mameliella sediminis]|uniref:glycosyltransferase n=1 Tax=Mameliella sediminis TaxID=2836866 RepID=UPI001C46F259|nr:glycosyltransferase [Mameliella sediminis]MBV7397340.1 glycosyltransferase [Mameliella sediminis]MBY6117313.1 glycosyltransferase [Antarctobacter heliothermus]MBY6147143.1 glycosyltransferase [Mameliella alba]